MGKVILTTGVYASKPYTLKDTNLKIHSLEQIFLFILQDSELDKNYFYFIALAFYI